MPNNRTIFKNWSDDGGIPDSNSVSRKTSALKPFKVVQTSISSGANIVNMQVPRQVITNVNVNPKEFEPAVFIHDQSFMLDVDFGTRQF